MMTLPLDKYQRIRLRYTLLACLGALMLSLILIYCDWRELTLIPSTTMWLYLGIFWLGNALFVATIIFGWNLRFAEPSLSLPQMLWAVSTSFFCLTLIKDLHYLVYLMVFTVAGFGIFQLNSRQYKIFCVLTLTALAVALGYLHKSEHRPISTSDAVVTWLVFFYCMFSLIFLLSGLTKLKSRLKQRNEELANALEIKDQFLANISHEIRTPLNGVMGMIEVLLRSNLRDDQKRYAEIGRSSADALLNVLNDLLDISKISSGKLVLESVVFDPINEIAEAGLVFSNLCQNKDIELITDIDPNMPSAVRGDPNRFRQILNNLLSNAVKFTESGEIIVTAASEMRDDNMAIITVSVRDTGIGMAPDVQESLFGEFFQADASTTRLYGGTGLGLAISKQLCGLFNGGIEVESTKGEGSCFTFWVSLKTVEPSTARITDNNHLCGHRVLVVDDIETNRLVFRKLLEHVGIEVVDVSGANAALSELDKHRADHFDLIIVDVQMPELDGYSLVQLIRNEERYKNLKVLILSSIEGEPNQFDSLSIAAYLMKPIYPQVLYRNLVKIFSGQHRESLDTTPMQEDATTTDLPEPALHSTKSPIPQAGVPRPGSAASDNGSNNNPILNNINVLLVDDNEVNQQVAKFLLEDFGCLVTTADNGREALAALQQSEKQQPFQLVLMDCQMPVMDGYQATTAIRNGDAGERYRDVTIIAITAHAMKEHKQKCLNFGMNDHIVKPLDPEITESVLVSHVGKFHALKP